MIIEECKLNMVVDVAPLCLFKHGKNLQIFNHSQNVASTGEAQRSPRSDSLSGSGICKSFFIHINQ